MPRQQQQQPPARLHARVFLLLLLAAALQLQAAFLVPSIRSPSPLRRPHAAVGVGVGVSGRRQRAAGAVVALAAKGKGKSSGSKKSGSKSRGGGGGSSSGGFGKSPPAPEPEQQEAGASSATAAEGQGDSEGGFSILGSAEPARSPSKGFGAPKGAGPTAGDVDAAYEQALAKIKGEPSKPKPAFPGAAGGPGAGEMNNGKVPVRNVDIFDVLPESLQNGFETTLIAALALNLVVIIGLGIGFSVQAIPTANLDLPASVLGAATTIRPLVEKWEFLFTPSLISFFIVSSLLGSFKIAQLGKGGTTYREK